MTLNSDLITSTIDDLNNEISMIEDQLIDISIETKGGINFENAKQMPYYMRQRVIKKLNKRAEANSGQEWL